MSVCLLLIHDGRRECLNQALETLHHLEGNWQETVVVDDSDHELGFAGAIQAGWDRILGLDPVPRCVFHLEADFRLLGPVDLAGMEALLNSQRHLHQVSLKRQPWNEREKVAGGIVEADPADFAEKRSDGLVWTEHRRYFTTNPSMYLGTLCELGWPQEPRSEGVFTHRILRWPGRTPFAIWGGKFDPPRCEHVGHERIGVGY